MVFTRPPAAPGRAFVRCVRLGFAVAAAVALGACQNMAANTGVYYNDGLAESANSVLLKNIIRSAKGYPMYYTALGDFSADRSSDVGFSPSVDVPFNVGGGALIDGDIEFSLSPSTSFSRDHNANASSLETEDFTQAMHTSISAKTFQFFADGRDPAELNLLLMLMVDRLTVTQREYQLSLQIAYQHCLSRGPRLPAVYRGVCQSLIASDIPETCVNHPVNSAGSVFTSLSNDPTNPCEFSAFKFFVEALAVTEPDLSVQDDGSATVTLESENNSLTIFKTKDTGAVLRSPHEIVNYLGKIIKQTFLGDDEGLLTLSSASGDEIPIFLVEEGRSYGHSSIATQVDGEAYWIPKQNLRSSETHYTFKAMGILKDVISLNTSPDQLPDSSTRIVVQ